MKRIILSILFLISISLCPVGAHAQVTGASLTIQSPGCTSVTYTQLISYSYNFGVPVMCWDTSGKALYYWNGATSGTIFTALSGGGGTPIASGAGDFGSSTSQTGSVLTGQVVSTHLTAGLPVNQGGTGAQAAGATAANNIGALAEANNLSDLANPQTAQANIGLQFYADNCRPALPNNGSSDDAANLRTCMATMPAGATMNLDGQKPYFFASHSTSDAVFGSQPCEIYVKSGQTLMLNGATITPSTAEMAVSNDFMICAGSLNFNNPGSSGGSPTFDAIADTSYLSSPSTITLSTAADYVNYHPNDDIYIDCGSNTGNQDVFVGWNQIAACYSSGQCDLKYPMLKSYNHTASGCPGSPSAARIYDWTTSGGGSSGANLGPLAHDVYIEGPGTLTQPTVGSPALNMIVLQGTVGWGIDNLHLIASWNTQAFFANNNHLGHASHDTFIGPGCGSDIAFNVGEFASSYDDIDHDTVTSTGNPGVGCGSAQEIVYGDSEGTEAMHYAYDTAMVNQGLSTNVSSLGTCFFLNVTFGDTFDHIVCAAQNGQMYGFVDDAPQFTGTGPLASTGFNKISHSRFIANGPITFNVPDDSITDSTIDGINPGNGAVYVENWWASITDNIINVSGCSATDYGINVDNSINKVTGNTIHNSTSGVSNCTQAIHLASSSSTNPVTIADNEIDAGVWSSGLTNFTPANFPKASVMGNPGILDYNGANIFTVGTLPATCTVGQPSVIVTDALTITTNTCSTIGGSGTNVLHATCQPSNTWECAP